jgi:hypothetical protein
LKKLINQLINLIFKGNVLDFFQNIVKNELEVSAAVAAIRTLMNILENIGDGKSKI